MYDFFLKVIFIYSNTNNTESKDLSLEFGQTMM